MVLPMVLNALKDMIVGFIPHVESIIIIWLDIRIMQYHNYYAW